MKMCMTPRRRGAGSGGQSRPTRRQPPGSPPRPGTGVRSAPCLPTRWSTAAARPEGGPRPGPLHPVRRGRLS